MKRYQWTYAILFAIASVVIAACGSAPSSPESVAVGSDQLPKNPDGYADIDVQQLAGLLQDEDLILVNVHVPYEGEIPQTDLFIPYDEMAGHLDLLPDKHAPVVLYCRSGGMSTTTAGELAALGYTNVLELNDGFNAWKAAGYELLDNR
jgi:rhodanese-related sulfurtransferase